MKRPAHWFSDALFPEGTNKHGPLPALLVMLSVSSGLVDAVTYLGMNRVFVANVTGNVVFAGFAIAGDPMHEFWAHLLALVSFAAGAWSEGRVARKIEEPRRRLFHLTATHAVLVAAALAVVLVAGEQDTFPQTALIVLLGFGMGMQNAVALRMAVPDLVTITVVTSVVTRLVSQKQQHAWRRRACAVIALFAGALIGTALYLLVGMAAPLAVNFVLLALIAYTARDLMPRPARQ
ncbi:YoaK family protein [Nonomuraea sp. NPDC049309]|uniref:YoaK family protein n=1 Tax=Nonomuraea sp. NPDC049309 TaxID=3364350 RepID=UPI00371EA2E7